MLRSFQRRNSPVETHGVRLSDEIGRCAGLQPVPAGKERVLGYRILQLLLILGYRILQLLRILGYRILQLQ